MNKTGRLDSLDFWRGVVLASIFVNHVPGNLVEHLTHRNYGFSDSAEAFVFLSGFVLAFVYWPRLALGEIGRVTRRCFRRAGALYGVHLALTLGAVLLFATAFMLGGHRAMIEDDNRALLFADGWSGLIGLLSLTYQLGYFNILPVYVVLMLAAPLLMLLLRRDLAIGLAVSAGIYLLARLGLRLPSWPVPYNWFLNPFAWQFLFTLGLAAGMVFRARGAIPWSRPVFLASVAVLAFGLLYATRVFGLAPDFQTAVNPLLDADKGVLGLSRLMHFLALAYVVSQIALTAPLLRLPGAGEVVRLGRQSLSIFAAGSILSALGQIVLKYAASRGLPFPGYQLVGIITVLSGLIIMVIVARYLEWRQGIAKDAAASVLDDRRLGLPSGPT